MKTIIEMAREAGLEKILIDWSCEFGNANADDYMPTLERFAALVRADEREACARLLDKMAAQDTLSNYYAVAARAIRERKDI